MLQLESEKRPQSCDGLTRRDFLRVGALGAGAVGLSLADLRRRFPEGCQLYPPLPRRRSQSARHLGPEARRPRDDSRPVPADFDQRPRYADQRTFPPHGPAGTALRHRSLGPSRGSAHPRDRPAADADRAPVPRWPRISALWRCAVAAARTAGRGDAALRRAAGADRPHRRQRRARPGRRRSRRPSRAIRPARRPGPLAARPGAARRRGRRPPRPRCRPFARSGLPPTVRLPGQESVRPRRRERGRARRAMDGTPSASRACWPGG